MPIIMTISVVVILVQQRETLQQIIWLNSQLLLQQTSKTDQLILYKCKVKYHFLNNKVVHLCSTISAYSKQWSAYLSTALPVHILSVSYLVFVLFFSNIPLLLKYMFVTGSTTVVSILFLHTNLCAQVVRYNGAYERQCAAFTKKLQQLKLISSNEQLKYQSTAEKWQFAFKFINEHTINPSTFPLVSSAK